MFLYLETYYVRPGLQDVIDGRVRSLHENHATNPAFAASDWLKYLGDGTTYLAFRLWHEREVSFDAAQGEWMAEYNRTRPPDAFLQPPDIEFFDQVDQVDQVDQAEQAGRSGGASFVVRCDLHVSGQSAWSSWEDELKKRLSGSDQFREYRLYRFMGGENRYLRTEFWDSREAATAFWRDSGMREFTAKLVTGRRAPAFGYYDVLHQLGSVRRK